MALDVEEFQRLISEVETKELEDLKHTWYKPDESDPPENPDLYPSPFHSYSYDVKKSTPSYFQVQRNYTDDLFLEEIDKDDVQRCCIPSTKKSNIFKHEVAWLLSHCPAFDIRDAVMKAAERIGDSELYQKTIRGLATLIMSLYSPETLCRRHHPRSHHTQTNHLWQQIKLPKTPCIPAFCSTITHPTIDYAQYPLVTQADTDEFITHYVDRCIFNQTRRPRAPYASYPPPQRKKDDLFKEMYEVVDKMECPNRLKGDLDEYTRLLIKLVGENSWDKEQELADRIMSVIDISCKEWKSDMLVRVLCMIKGEELRIQRLSAGVRGTLYHLVYDSDSEKCADAPRIFVCADIWNVIGVAELRREALGSRFIKRSHLLWAFYELGFGLSPKILWKFDNIEDEDRPPYYIYLGSMKLAKSLGNEIVQLQHFMFVVLFVEDIADDENLATAMKKRRFTDFLQVSALDSVMRPNDNACLWMKKVNQSTLVK